MTKQWDEYRHIILSLYKEQNKPLHEVQRFMEEEHGFKASIRAYRSRFDKWKVYKYTRRQSREIISSKSHSPSHAFSDSSMTIPDSMTTTTTSMAASRPLPSPLPPVESFMSIEETRELSFEYANGGICDSTYLQLYAREDPEGRYPYRMLGSATGGYYGDGEVEYEDPMLQAHQEHPSPPTTGLQTSSYYSRAFPEPSMTITTAVSSATSYHAMATTTTTSAYMEPFPLYDLGYHQRTGLYVSTAVKSRH